MTGDVGKAFAQTRRAYLSKLLHLFQSFHLSEIMEMVFLVTIAKSFFVASFENWSSHYYHFKGCLVVLAVYMQWTFIIEFIFFEKQRTKSESINMITTSQPLKTSQELWMLSRSLSDCKSLLLNVLIQDPQFVRNNQLCH